MVGGNRTARYLEVERKFDVASVGDSTPPPSFHGVTAVAAVQKSPSQSLDAVYFDTPSYDLAANRVTLRRRSGGVDAGWHLKLPAGPETRTEVRAPLDRTAEDAVPDDLRDLVLAIVRDRPLAPVARISTSRQVQRLHGADGAVLAEFCDDHVTASLLDRPGAEQQWREWELELVDIPDGSATTAPELLDRLSDRVLDAGATPAAHSSKLARVLGGVRSTDAPAYVDPVHRAVAHQVNELLVWDRAVREDADDAVHQMRVTIRKIRSLLQGSADAFELSDPTDISILDELRWLAGLLGVARDAEVLAQRYRRALDGLSPDLIRGRVVERLVDGAMRNYRSGLRQSLAAMRSARYFRLLDSLDALITARPADDPVAAAAAPLTVDAAYRRVTKATRAARAAGQAGRDEALHRIRKAVKRLRYTAAATDAPLIAERAKAIQSLLGDHQDSVVSRAHLLQQAAAAHAAGEDTFTYGVLYQQEDDVAAACRAQLDDALSELAEAADRGGRVGL